MKFLEAIGYKTYMPHRVSYGETDTMGVLYHAEYLHICERARNYLGREVNFTYKEMEKEGLILPVKEAEIRYRSPIVYDDLIYVEIGVSEWKKASVRFAYKIYNEEKTIVMAEASTLHACINKEGKICPLETHIKDKFFSLQ